MRKHLVTAAVIAAATVFLSGCAERHDEDAARDLGNSFAASLAAHDGKFCDLLTKRPKKEMRECRKSEEAIKKKLEADPQPKIVDPRIYKMMAGERRAFGIALEFTRGGNQEFLAIEAIRSGNKYRIVQWGYAEKADYNTDRVITNTLGW